LRLWGGVRMTFTKRVREGEICVCVYETPKRVMRCPTYH
jgi:hypothetical protein